MIRKILLGLLVLFILLIVTAVAYIQLNYDRDYSDWPEPKLKASTDPAMIERGEYLATGPAHCGSCHINSFQDFVDAEDGKEVVWKGGLTFPMGPLGKMSSGNLTPDPKTGLGRYSDGQLFRLLKHGIKPDGQGALSLMMPFWDMADEDLVAIVSYLRSIEPVENKVPENEWSFVGKAVRALTPTFKPIENPNPPAAAPAMAATIERGEYLARSVANCVGCHTPRDPMTFEAIGPEYSGGMEFEPWPELYKFLGEDPDTWLRSPNITPAGVLARFETSQDFIDRFRQGRLIRISPMDWQPFSTMSDEDLTAIYMYLNTLDPVENDIGDIAFKKEE